MHGIADKLACTDSAVRAIELQCRDIINRLATLEQAVGALREEVNKVTFNGIGNKDGSIQIKVTWQQVLLLVVTLLATGAGGSWLQTLLKSLLEQ